MRIVATLLLITTTSLACAQSGDMQTKIERAQKAKAELEKRFEAADADHDGKLTKTEADGKMPKVYEAFDEIDSDHVGYVTLQQVGKFAQSKIKARRAQGGE
jgi:Ca2+-binding EF-hand superfamily protein